ncbi:hypothetical protein [Dyella sp. A6]|uniref:hypothetical protein n=1 Tax=Dyella aluminiiresistens TaxID=3069105 RepID=UPI002E75B09D|nr:hypothetical protein [Dyella sp. A6]
MRATLRLLPLSLLFAGSLAAAQSAPPPGPGPMPRGPMGPGSVPSPAQLATLPGLSTAQQQQLRQLLIQRRDAHEALRQREQAASDKIDTDSAKSIRSLLGEKAYVRYAKWSLGHGPHDHGGHAAPPPQNGRDDSSLLPPDLDDSGLALLLSGSSGSH